MCLTIEHEQVSEDTYFYQCINSLYIIDSTVKNRDSTLTSSFAIESLLLYFILDIIYRYCITVKIHFHASCMLNVVKMAKFTRLSKSENFKLIEFVQL